LNSAVADGFPSYQVTPAMDEIKSKGWIVFLFEQDDTEQNLVVIEKN